MSVRKLLFWVHLAVGCVAGVVIFLLSLTGVLLAFERQIEGVALDRIQIQSPPPGTKPLAIEQLPIRSDGPPPVITLRPSAQAPVQVSYGRERTVLIDGYTGRSLGEAPRGPHEFFAFSEKIHRALGGALRNSIGHSVVDASNFLFLFLVVSGFYLWFPKRWNAKSLQASTWFRRGLSGRARNWNWHNTVGFWCSIPLFFIVLSGVIMSYQWATNLLYTMTGTQPPAAGRPREGGAPRRGQAVAQVQPTSDLLATIQTQNPGWRSISFPLPAPSDRRITFTVDQGTGGQPQKRFQKTVDRVTGATLREEGFDTLNAGRKLRTIARFLHTGEILGLPGQFVAALASLGAMLLVWTGLSLALQRFNSWRRRRRAPSEQLESVPTVSA